MMFLWWKRRRKLRDACESTEESERIRAEAERQLAEVERDAGATLELARSMREYARVNNFAAMVDEAFRVRARKRGTQQ